MTTPDTTGLREAVEALIAPHVTRDEISGRTSEIDKVHVRVRDVRAVLDAHPITSTTSTAGPYVHNEDDAECLWGTTDQKWYRMHPLYPLQECDRDHGPIEALARELINTEANEARAIARTILASDWLATRDAARDAEVAERAAARAREEAS